MPNRLPLGGTKRKGGVANGWGYRSECLLRGQNDNGEYDER